MLLKCYRIKEIIDNIDRDKTTVLRWEKQGLIPKAKRDSRGWRYYSQKQIEKILDLIQKTNYFRNTYYEPRMAKIKNGKQKKKAKTKNY